ncbi:MAG: hypothetical protein DDT34_02471 [Firmicutes bacterium]|nr:hypothetical protein [Bacillota bacterium]
MIVPAAQLDANPELLGVGNGVLDIREGRFVSEDGEIVTRKAGCEFIPDAKCPVFDSFMRSTYGNDKDIIRCVLTLLAMSLSGRTGDQVFVVLLGDRGRNGKSVLLSVMHQLLGDYAAPIDKRLVVRGYGEAPRFSASQLEGRRFAYASEASGRVKLDTEFVKSLSAGDSMFVERKGVDGYHITPGAKLWLAVNSLPEAVIDPSLMSRAYLIPHTVSFYAPEDTSYRDGDQAPDSDLPRRLAGELPGILALLVRVYRDIYLEHGLSRPPAVVAAARRYESENDGVSLWLDEKCVIGTQHRYRTGEAFSDYLKWAKTMNITSFTQLPSFVKRLRQQPGLDFVKPNNKSTIIGIGPADLVEQPSWGMLGV